MVVRGEPRVARSNAVVALLTSRVLGGVAYSLLFSSFESWVITEADEMRIDRKKLVGLFSVATLFNAAPAGGGTGG